MAGEGSQRGGYAGVIGDEKVKVGSPVVHKWPRGGRASWMTEKERGAIVDRSVMLSRKPTQPEGGSCCYPRVRREHR